MAVPRIEITGDVGCGKTTLAIAISYGLSMYGIKTVIKEERPEDGITDMTKHSQCLRSLRDKDETVEISTRSTWASAEQAHGGGRN